MKLCQFSDLCSHKFNFGHTKTFLFENNLPILIIYQTNFSKIETSCSIYFRFHVCGKVVSQEIEVVVSACQYDNE